jgi:translocation and assembly module TamB
LKLRVLVYGLLLAALLLAGALLWLVASESGLQWVVAKAQSASAGRLRIERARGALASGVFADRVSFDAGGTKIVAERFGGRLRVFALLSARVEVEPLSIDHLSLALGESEAKPAKAPSLPVALTIADATAGRVDFSSGETKLALRDVRIGHFDLGALHRLSGTAQFTLADAPYPGTGKLDLDGTLEHLKATLALQVEGAHGELKASLAPFQEPQIESLELRASALDLARFHRSAPSSSLAVVARAQGTRTGLSGTVSLANSQAGALDAGRLPVASLETGFATDAAASARFDHARIVLAGGGVLQGGGEIAPGRGSATFEARGLNLRALQSTLRQTALDGVVHLEVSPDSQALRAALSQQGIMLSAEALRRGDTIEIGALHAQAEGGEVSGSGSVRLGSPLSFTGRFELAHFDPAAFGDYPEGSVNGTLEAAGHLGDAPQVDLRWSVADSMLYDLPLETQGSARVAARRVRGADAKVRLGEMQLTAQGSFGATGDELRFTLRVPELSEIASDIAGRLQARGTLRGAWQAPQAELSVDAEALQAPGGIVVERASARFAGTAARHGLSLTVHAYDSDAVAELRGGLQGGTWRGQLVSLVSQGAVELETIAPAPLTVSRERIELGRLEAKLARGRFLVREVVRTRDGVRSSGEFTGLRTGWALVAAGLQERIRSTLLLDGDWTITAAPALEGTVRVRRSQGDITVLGERPIDLGLEAVSLDARLTSAGVAAKMEVAARLLSAALGGEIRRAPGAGGLGLGRGSPIVVQGNLDLASLSVLAGAYVADGRVDGKVSADVEVGGTLGAPALAATLHGEAMSLELPPYGVYLRDGELVARLAQDVLTVEQFSVHGGQGTLTAKGGLPLRLADGNAKLAWQARQFTAVDRQDVRLVVSGDGEIGFDGKKLLLTGELRADRGSVEYASDRLPKLADDIVVEGESRRTTAAKTQLPVSLNIDLDLGSNLTVALRGFDGKLTGRVNLKTTADGELRAYGEVRAAQATYFAYGKRLRVDPGIITFDGPLENPALQITAWRRNQQVEAGVQISGTVRAPRVQLVSQPPVPEGEKLTWLVLGRPPSDTTKADLGLLQAAAGALLARGEITSMPLDQRLARTFGLDEISLRGSGEAEDRVVAFGKRLSDKVYVSYEQGIGTVASNLVKLDYSISRRWSVRAETGTSSGGGLFYRFSWD